MKRRILVLGQGMKGGTDFVLSEASNWLRAHGHTVFFGADLRIVPDGKFDLAILPTSRMEMIPRLSDGRAPVHASACLVWCMGSGAFHGAFHNHNSNGRLHGLIRRPMSWLANLLLSRMLNERAVIFTDEVGMYGDLEWERNSDLPLEDLIYPIPMRTEDGLPQSARRNRKPLEMAWVGRIDEDFKILPLLKLLRDIDRVNRASHFETALNLTIVGSGNAEDQLTAALAQTGAVKVRRLGWLDTSEMNKLLVENIDVLFAMGSSALHGAIHGVPTVLVRAYSVAEDEVEDIYRWIHETAGHSLGEFPRAFCKPEQPSSTFEGLFAEPIGLDVQGDRARAYSLQFDIDRVMGRLESRDLPSYPSRRTMLLLRTLGAIKGSKRVIKALRDSFRTEP